MKFTNNWKTAIKSQVEKQLIQKISYSKKSNIQSILFCFNAVAKNHLLCRLKKNCVSLKISILKTCVSFSDCCFDTKYFSS